MAQATAIEGSASIAAPAATAAATAAGPTGFSFRALLSDLNPLQYVPVVGAIYRAVTGDEGDPNLRFVASLGTSFAIGGPVGIGITVAEKLTGIDPERIVRHLLSGLLHPTAPAGAGAGAGAGTPPPPADPAPVADMGAVAVAGATGTTARPWTADELAAYRVAGDGAPLAGSDLLNALELRRLSARIA